MGVKRPQKTPNFRESIGCYPSRVVGQLPLQCSCGSLRGVVAGVTPRRSNRLVCMCDDCQTYAHWLGRAAEVLDPHGGTEVVQVTPAMLQITEGIEHLQCARLSPKGLHRWYAACCKTPLANTLGAKMPFVGIIHLALRSGDDAMPSDADIGPILARVNARFGHGAVGADAHARAPFGFILRSIGKLARDALHRAHRPSPFFDDKGDPVVEPTVLSKQARLEAKARCGPVQSVRER